MELNKNKKKLGLWLSSSLVVGNMTGSGIFLLPSALAIYGGISLFGWLATTVGAIFLAIVFSRLSRIVTKPGGPYIYAREGFGDLAGFSVAWGYWVSIWCGNAAIAVAGVSYLSVFFPALKDNNILSAIAAIAAIWLFTLINTRNIRRVGEVQLLTTLIKIIPLIALGGIGIFYIDINNFNPMNLSGGSSFEAITATAALTLWAFLGLESATIPSDKVKQPEKTIPRATIIGTAFTAVLYISASMAVMGLVEPGRLQASTAPFSDAAANLWGAKASAAVALGAVIACFGALNGWILLQAQLPGAAAKEKLFPDFFAKTSRHGVPLAGLILSSILASILVAMNYTKGLVQMFTFMIMLSTLTVLLPYLFSSLAEIMILIKKDQKIRMKRLIKPILISIPAFLYSLWAVAGLGIKIIIMGMGLLILGLPVFWYVNRRRGATSEKTRK